MAFKGLVGGRFAGFCVLVYQAGGGVGDRVRVKAAGLSEHVFVLKQFQLLVYLVRFLQVLSNVVVVEDKLVRIFWLELGVVL